MKNWWNFLNTLHVELFRVSSTQIKNKIFRNIFSIQETLNSVKDP